MSEELRILREATEIRCAVLDNEKWVSKPNVFDLPPYGEELPNSNNISNIDKNGIRGEGRGISIENKQLRGLVLFLQAKLNEHLDKTKSRLEDGY